MDLYLKLVDVLFPVFCNWYRLLYRKKDSNFDTNFITNFAGNIGTPAMIFYTITSTGVTLITFVEYFLYSFVIIAGFTIVGIIFLFILRKDIVSELPPLILPNTGNMEFLYVCLLMETLV